MDMNTRNRLQNCVQMEVFVQFVMNHKYARLAHLECTLIAKDQHQHPNVHRVSAKIEYIQLKNHLNGLNLKYIIRIRSSLIFSSNFGFLM